MTVKELIEILKELDPKRKVIIAKDTGGNGYSPLSSHWLGTYEPETTYMGEAWLEKLTAEDLKAGYTDEDVFEDGEKAVFLVPTH